jgi:excinuclease ABC subunit B
LENQADAGLALEALPELIDQLESKMKDAAKKLDFEEAANLRDRVKQLRQKMAGSR